MAKKKEAPPTAAFKVVGLSGDLYEYLWSQRQGEETPNEVLRRLLKMRHGREGLPPGPRGWGQRGKGTASVRLDRTVFEKLQRHAVPLEDTAADVLRRLLKIPGKKG